MSQQLKWAATRGRVRGFRRSGGRAGKAEDRRDRDTVGSGGRRSASRSATALRSRSKTSAARWAAAMSKSWSSTTNSSPTPRSPRSKACSNATRSILSSDRSSPTSFRRFTSRSIDTKTFLISPNAGPSSYAGKNCSPFFYVTSYQNDQVHEVLGKVAQDRGYKRVYVMEPNYQAGKDSAAGFKLDYKGEIVEESYIPLGTLDFQVEISKIASLKPDAVFTFMPGGMGVSLVKQYKQAGLADKIPVLSAFTVDESTLPAQQDAAVGMFGGADWAPDLNNPQSKKFVAGYEAAYNSVPGTYAMQGYDAALLIDSAVKAVKGDLSNKDAVAAALKKADFTSLRGNFKFNINGYPIQDFYLTKVAKRPDGKFETEIVQKVFENYGDRYAKECVPGKSVSVTGKETSMKSEITGITRANEGIQGISWNILGQTYVPKSHTDHCFSWHATFPPGTFVPPHIHPDQDEYLYLLEGKLDFMLGGADAQATPGDLVRLGMGIPHGIFNKSDQVVKVLFWVSPTQKLYDLFWEQYAERGTTQQLRIADLMADSRRGPRRWS